MKTPILTNIEQFIPTLILKNTVLFPNVALPVLISKTVSLNAIHRAIEMGKEKVFIALPWNDVDPKEINLDTAQEILDREHFGLEKIKKHIVQHLAVMKLSPNKKGSIFYLLVHQGWGKLPLGKVLLKPWGENLYERLWEESEMIQKSEDTVEHI